MPILEDSKPAYPVEICTSFHQELLNKEDVIPFCSSSFEKFDMKPMQVIQHNTPFRDQAVQVQPKHKHVACQVIKHYADKVIQACVSKYYRSKQMQFSTAVKDAISSPIQPIAHQSTVTSPTKPSEGKSYKASTSGQTVSRRKLIFNEEKYDSDVSYTLSLGGASIDSSPSKPSSQTTVDSLQEKIIKTENLNLQNTLSKINQNPRLYIGIPAELYFIVTLISKHTKLSDKHSLLCFL